MNLYYLPSYPIRMRVSSICSGNNIILSRLGLTATDANSLHFLIHQTVVLVGGFLFLWEDDLFRNQDKLFSGKKRRTYTLFRFDISSLLAVLSVCA